MSRLFSLPGFLGPIIFVVLWSCACIGTFFRRSHGKRPQEQQDDFGVVLAASLTLLGLIIGFAFSMAISHYDQRKNYEEEEANAIGTEYVRADLLPAASADRVRQLLKDYTAQRMLFYTGHSQQELAQVATRRAELQQELWSAVTSAITQPTPIIALTVAGMNDVLNSQGYTQAAWSNQIPVSAWTLLTLLAALSNIMLGYGARSPDPKKPLLLLLPLMVSIAFFLIADIDSPRGGIIRVRPQNLQILADSLR